MTDHVERDPLSLDAPAEVPGLDEVERLVSALHDPTRRRILLALLGDGQPHTIDELARLAGVHRTVAFNHLERLTALGYLEKSQRRGRPGKPASLYSVRLGVLSVSYPPRQYATLATVLATGVTGLGASGAAATREAGVRLGERLALAKARSVAEALLPLRWLGAEYAVGEDEILAGTCVFLEACSGARDVVCGVQAGILEGALRGAGIDATVEARGPRADNGCAYGLTRPKRAERWASHLTVAGETFGVVVVGAGLAGAQVAVTLREEGFVVASTCSATSRRRPSDGRRCPRRTCWEPRRSATGT